MFVLNLAPAVVENNIFQHLSRGRVQKKKKKVWNFPYFSGVGGFEKVIFNKKIKIKIMV